MNFHTKNRVVSFRFALEGLNHALRSQPNFQIQLILAAVVLVAAWFMNFDRVEWLVLILTIGLVLTAELVNTVIEVVVDLAVKEQMLIDAKIAKDVAAAAVLVSSLVAVVVGIVLFWPHLTF